MVRCIANNKWSQLGARCLCVAFFIVVMAVVANCITLQKNALAATETGIPVYRLYNYLSSEHLYTTSETEYNNLVDQTNRGKSHWIKEGIAWYAPSEPADPTAVDAAQPVYRLYNASLGAFGKNAHYYTSDEQEIETLTKSHGWKSEGVFFYSGGTTAIYTAYSEKLNSAHFYTAIKTEWTGLDSGWNQETAKNTTSTVSGVFQAISAGKTEVNWSVCNNLFGTGTYTIEAKCAPNTYVELAGNTWARGTNIQTYSGNGTDAQKWWLDVLGTSTVRFNNSWNSLRIDVVDGNSANGTNVRAWLQNEGDAQKWSIEISNEGYVRFKNLASSKYLDVAGGTGSGSNVQIYEGNGYDAQSFKLARVADVSITGNSDLDGRLRDIINNRFGATGDLLRQSYNYVRGFSYRSGSLWPSGNWSPRFALEMLQRGSGNCYRYAALFNELAWALHYETRAIAGQVLQTGGWGAHGWVEITQNGRTYLCDPELCNYVSGNFYMTTYAAAPCYYKK